MTTKMQYSIFIVDEHPVIFYGMVEALREREFRIAGYCHDMNQSLKQIVETKPDILVLEPGATISKTVDFLVNVRAQSPLTKIVCYAANSRLGPAKQCLKSGVHGYLLKSDSIESLPDQLKKVLSGEVAVSHAVTTKLVNSFRHVEVEIEDFSNELSKRELEIFRLIGTAYSTSEIANALCVAVKTVETHRQNIRSKLGLKNMTELICKAAIWVSQSNEYEGQLAG